MKLTPKTLAAFEADVLKRYPEEACGFIIKGRYVPMKNVAEDPLTTFRIDPKEYVKAAKRGIAAVMHSHPYSMEFSTTYPPQWPSTADMKGWLNHGVPWGICATNGEGITEIVWLDDAHPAPLVGREFIHGVNDCYSVIRDWFRMERGIVLPNFARGMEWWERGEDLYDQNFEAAGFKTIPFEEASVGDCVLFRVASPVTNHAAVITGENEILHHLFHRQSGHDTLSKWTRVINRAVRYVGNHTDQ